MASLVPMVDSPTLPIADYFFISGLETSQIFDTLHASTANGNGNGNGSLATPRPGDTIDEDGPYTADSDQRPRSSQDASDNTKRRSARFSYEARKSIASIINLESGQTNSASNRSSATIKPIISDANGASIPDEDFDKALRNFANDRENFLEDISMSTHFNAGQTAQPQRLRSKAKTQRVGGGGAGTGLDDKKKEDKNMGSLRRRLSTMNPLSRQGTTVKRQSARQSKRISGYNSVMPAPQRLRQSPDEHPLKRAYEPVLLDRYPSEKDVAELADKRNPFPDYVPMFVFPKDIHVVSQESRPRTTWHGFTMTSGNGVKLYGMCLIAWTPLPDAEAAELEMHCEKWRSKNISEEDQEVLKVISDKLSRETAKLSRLLAELPSIQAETHLRDAHEEEISRVEENIALMNQIIAPMRHGTTSRIDGLGNTLNSGFWVPRAYGILGRDGNMTSFWKEWLRAVAIPITHGTLLHVPPSSPTTGVWQPLERYVVNLCTEAPQPNTSQVQVEVSLRELKLFARREAINEFPGSRNTDLYPLFRCLNVPDILILFEYVLAESRIILLSSQAAMLQSACAAITQLIWPMKWSGAYVPVLPARMMEMLEAPFPYIFGIERRYLDNDLPDDDFVLVDLDQGTIEATAPPISLPRQQRRKLLAILQLAAPHHNRFGVPLGPPRYISDAYPSDTFPSESPSIFDPNPPRSNFAHLASLSSAAFGTPAATPRSTKIPMLNVFLQSQKDKRARSAERPATASTFRTNSPPSPTGSPTSTSFPKFGMDVPSLPRNDSASVLQNSLREKRSGRLDPPIIKRNSSVSVFDFDVSEDPQSSTTNTYPPKFGLGTMRRPSVPFANHQPAASISTLGSDSQYGHSSSTMSNYAPSVYAQSTLAASTIMPQAMMQPVQNTDSQIWSEGHCLLAKPGDAKTRCHVCDERSEERMYQCTAAFHPDQIMMAFARCFASLFYTYRKFLTPANAAQKKTGLIYGFNWEQFLRSVPGENSEYLSMLKETQAQTLAPTTPSLHLFDAIISAKRSRGAATSRLFSRTGNNPAAVSFLADTSDHLWATAASPSPNTRSTASTPTSAGGTSPGNEIIGGRRYLPGKLDPSLMHKPRAMAGKPAVKRGNLGMRRKMVPSMMINTEVMGQMGPVSAGGDSPDHVLYTQSAPGLVERRTGSKLKE